MLEIVTPASVTALTTLAAVKADLGLTDADEDAYLSAQIERVSAFICTFLAVVQADDGSRTLGRETLTEWIEAPLLSRVPVVSITSMEDGNGEALDPDDYVVDKPTGRFYGANARWMNLVYNYTPPVLPMAVTYTAGWLLPGETGRNLPHDIEAAALALIKAGRAGRGRDPLVKSEDVPGLIRTEYWVGTVSDSAMPPDIAARLSLHKRLTV